MTLVGKDAQVEFDRIYGPQKALATFTDLPVDNSDPTPKADKWDGVLVIKDCPYLKTINLTGNLIDEITIINCPNLEDVDLADNEFKKIDLSKLSGDVPNTSLKEFSASNNDKLEEINFKSCIKIKKITLNNCGEVKKFEGGEGFDASLNEVQYENTHGISFTGTSHLVELKAAKEAVDIILGGEKLPMKKDPSDPAGIKEMIDVDATKTQIIVKGSENPDSPAKKALDAIKAELGLGTGATKDQIIAEIKRLKGPDYISKVSLTTDAEDSLKGLGIAEGEISKLSAAASARDVEISRNKLVSDRFNELQSKLNNAHYINIGLGTLSAGILIILIWMILKDRKLLPGQEEEEVKE